jgi:predicted RNA binding protein YcfA (HicA-like mRNA interferase family)
MAKKDKLKAKLFAIGQENNFRLDELCTLLRQLGFNERQGKGSHRIFTREGVEDLIDLQPAKDGKAKPYQVKQIRGIVKACDL